MSAKSVVVIGGGVVGLCVAYSAMRRGHAVTVVDRGPVDGDRCSLGNAGMIVPSHFIPLASPGMVRMGLRMMRDPEGPFAIRPRPDVDLLRWGWLFATSSTASHVERSSPLLRDLNMASRKLYTAMATKFRSPFALSTNGLMMLCKTDHALEEEARVAEMACDLDVPARVLTAREAAELDPGMTMDIAGAVHFPLDCHLDPSEFVGSLTSELSAGGATLVWSQEVTGWQFRGGRITAVETRESTFDADEFVLAAGAWSPDLMRKLNLRLPMQAGKGYSVTLPSPRQLPRVCSILTEARVAVTPMGARLRFGGTMEVGGKDLSVREGRVRGIVKAIPRYFPEFQPDDFKDIPVWSGLRPCSPDGLPYVGRFRRYANLSAATGHAMMGVSLAPVTGEIIGDLLSQERTVVDLMPLSPDRFG